jgi:hypothetical protein
MLAGMDEKEKTYKDKVREMGEVKAREHLNIAANSFHIQKKQWTLDVIQEFEDARLKHEDAFNEAQIREAREANQIARKANTIAVMALIIAIIAAIITIIPFLPRG